MPSGSVTAKTQFYRRVNQTLVIVLNTLAILLVAVALYTVRWILLSALIGVGLGVLLIPPTSYLRRKLRIPTGLSGALFVLLLISAVGALAYFLVNTISTEVGPTLSKLPELVHGFLGKLNPKISSYLQNFHPERSFGGAAQTLFAGVRFGASTIADLVFIAFIAIYLCVRPGEYLDGFVSLFPQHMRSKARFVLHECAESLRRWSWAQGLAMLIVGLLASVALLSVGSHAWAFLGIATGVLEVIPYFGPLTALASVTLITVAADPSALLKTEIAFLLLLALEGNVIVPLVMKGRIRLPPIHLLVLMAVLGEWFGIFGFLMAAPTLSILRTIYQCVLKPRLDRETVPPSEIPERTAA